jgi:hypothetical protein
MNVFPDFDKHGYRIEQELRHNCVAAIPLFNLIVFKRNRTIANYRNSEPNLIKP